MAFRRRLADKLDLAARPATAREAGSEIAGEAPSPQRSPSDAQARFRGFETAAFRGVDSRSRCCVKFNQVLQFDRIWSV